MDYLVVLVVAFSVFIPSFCTDADGNVRNVANTKPAFVNVGALLVFNSTIGRVAKTAIELAVKDVNNNANLLNGTKLVLHMVDSNCNAFAGTAEGIQRTKMTITWREREHEEQNIIALNDPGTVRALRDCGLLKYFHLSGMRQQMELLEFLLRAWDPTIEAFHIGNKVVPFLVEDIYFLTGLSRKGLPISLSGSALGGETVRDYILQYCNPGAEASKDGKINIHDVPDFPLRTILFTIAKLAGTATLHVANRSYMQYVLECMEPTVFNWVEVVLSQMKEQLSKAKGGRKKNFNYGSILISFALEWIPLMQPQHVTLGISNPRDPRMQRLVELMARHVGQLSIVLSTTFYAWFRRQIIAIDDYAYAGIDFRGDPDLALPEGAQWGAIDVGRVQPVGEPEHGADQPAERAVERAVLQNSDMTETLVELQ